MAKFPEYTSKLLKTLLLRILKGGGGEGGTGKKKEYRCALGIGNYYLDVNHK